LESLRGQEFPNFAGLNRAVRKRVAELSRQAYQKRAGSRESVFLELDKPQLRPLPPESYQAADYRSRLVPDNYHVEYEGFYYSVPYQYYKQHVTLKATSSFIEIYDGDRKRIACHERHYTGKRYVTLVIHMPQSHKAMWEEKGFDGNRYRSWARSVGDNTHFVIDALLTRTDIEETAYRSCMAILQQSKTIGNYRLEAACKKARELGSISYTTVKNILRNKQENMSLPAAVPVSPSHANIRGQAEFF
jgi:hypothetical protein